MGIADKYWKTILYTFLSYFSILMLISGVGFVIAGRILNPWYYFGLFSWPLFIMLGIVNLRYIHIYSKANREALNRAIGK